MSEAAHHLGILRELTWSHVLVLAVLIGCRLLVAIVRWPVRRAAESAPSHRRLLILRTAPIARLLIGIAGIAIIIPILIEPTFEDIIALLATVALALALATQNHPRRQRRTFCTFVIREMRDERCLVQRAVP